MKKYLIVIEPTQTGFSAYSPDLPGCISTGRTREEVELNMREAIAFHLDGLRDSGWRGDPGLARLGMCVMAAKWSWLVPHTLRGAAQGAHHVYGGRSVTTEQLIGARIRMLTYLCGMADEARQLGRTLLG